MFCTLAGLTPPPATFCPRVAVFLACVSGPARQPKQPLAPVISHMATLRRLAGISGASAVGAAAYGAHGMSDQDAHSQRAFANGNRMHLLHSIMIAVAPILKPRAPLLSGSLFAAGIAVFSGSCYAAALTGAVRPQPPENPTTAHHPWACGRAGVRENGRFAPVGGTTLIVAWLSLVA